ncbi:MAG: hypothetical protein ACQCN4_13695 [Candidatus Bathyarchaeia archaeon]|jgi:hypothetical protein
MRKRQNNGNRAFISLLVIIMAMSFFPSVLSLEITNVWNIQTVDASESVGWSSAIAIDSNNIPHVAYGGSQDVKYASLNWNSWKIENIAQGGGRIGLALDSNNTPHVVFSDVEGRLFYAKRNVTGWDIQTVSGDGTSGAIALDSMGKPHIAYLTTARVLKFASLISTGWDIRTVDNSQLFSDNLVSLALDSNNQPHILYGYDKTGSQNTLMIVKYATYNNSGWDIQTVNSDAISGGLGNLVLDSKDLPQFTYILPGINPSFGYTVFNSTLIYIKSDGLVWNTQIVASNLNWGSFAGYLILDSSDYPHIVYCNSSFTNNTGTLLYSEWTGTSWNTQTVDSSSVLNAGPVVLDHNRNPHLAYLGQFKQYGSFAGYLKYASINEIQYENNNQTQTLYIFLLVGVPTSVVLLIAVAYACKKRKIKTLKSDGK